MRYLILTILIFVMAQSGNAQQDTTAISIEEMKELKAGSVERLNEIKAKMVALNVEAEELKYQIAAFDYHILPWPRWSNGFTGLIGFNQAGTDNWFLREQPNISSTAINIGSSGFLTMDAKRFAWRNTYNINLGWLRFDDGDVEEENEDFRTTADIFNIASILDYKLSHHWSIATGVDYQTSLLDGKLNNPGYLNLGSLGVTYQPNPNFIFNFYSLNYNLVFSEMESSFESSLGARFDISYTKAIVENLIFKSNLRAFTSYEKFTGLSNYTWANSLNASIKGIGIILDTRLRSNKQEALAAGRTDNVIQFSYVIGLTYAFSFERKKIKKG